MSSIAVMGHRVAIFISILSLSCAVFAQTNVTSSLSCWHGKRFESRTAKTPVFRSPRGYAYGEVSAKANIGAEKAQECSNTVRLFYSADGKNYRVVWQSHRDLDGIGLILLGWDKSGNELLFQTRQWPYDSDADVVNDALLLDAASGKVRELRVGDALTRKFGSKCEFQQSVVGWRSDHDVVVHVTRTPVTESYDQVFCVKKPVDFVFDINTHAVSAAK